jgi:hypothetical protein
MLMMSPPVLPVCVSQLVVVVIVKVAISHLSIYVLIVCIVELRERVSAV